MSRLVWVWHSSGKLRLFLPVLLCLIASTSSFQGKFFLFNSWHYLRTIYCSVVWIWNRSNYFHSVGSICFQVYLDWGSSIRIKNVNRRCTNCTFNDKSILANLQHCLCIARACWNDIGTLIKLIALERYFLKVISYFMII